MVEPLDLNKFTQYFNTFHSHLAQLETQMHPDKTKFTRCLGKIRELCGGGLPGREKTEKTEIVSNQIKTVSSVERDRPIGKPVVRVRSNSKQSKQALEELGSIEEEEESPSRPTVARKRRSETAGGQRREYSTVDW